MSIETEVVSRIVDDMTGVEIKDGGWALIRIVDGEQFHTHSLIDLIALILDPEKQPLSGEYNTEYVRETLEQRGVIPSPVLSKGDDCRHRQPCAWETCICD